MNPGTTMFIVVGIIGLLMYALKALTKGSEGFMSLDAYNAVNSLFEAPVSVQSVAVPEKGSAQFKEALVNIRTGPMASYTVEHAVPLATAVPPMGQALTISDKQGAELQKARMEPFANPVQKPCPKMPDMSLYVRKDQIPCWGCTLR